MSPRWSRLFSSHFPFLCPAAYELALNALAPALNPHWKAKEQFSRACKDDITVTQSIANQNKEPPIPEPKAHQKPPHLANIRNSIEKKHCYYTITDLSRPETFTTTNLKTLRPKNLKPLTHKPSPCRSPYM